MRSLLFSAVLLASAVAAAGTHKLNSFDGPTPPPSPPAPTTAGGHWVDLFSPPYTGVPKVSMAISCISGQHCFLPGGTNSEGFDMFLFDGHTNGRFTPLQMPDKAFMMMAIGMGGTEADPKGVAGGFGIGNGLQYAKSNGTVFDPSQVPTLFVETQDIRASADGMDVIAVDSAHVLYSANGGQNFTENAMTGLGQCAEGRYGAMVSKTEWYVTLGSWPESNSKAAKGEKRVSERVSMVNGKRVNKNVFQKVMNKAQAGSGSGNGGDDNCGYTAAILKTVDGGNTFTSLFNQSGPNADFYWNGIDCSSSTNCVAVGEGFNANAAGHIYHTTDGKTFTEVKKLVSGQSGAFSLMSVKFKTATEVWVAGSKQSELGSSAVFMVSMDGGATWTDESGTLANIGDISDVSFTKDGKHGFATAITVYDDSTILRYGAKLPPAPPAPPTQAPAGMFTQMNCPSAGCASGCQNRSFPAGQCLQLEGGGSAVATCTPTTLVQTVYLESNSCSGPSNQSSMPLETCLKSDAGNYFENFCPNEVPVPPSPPVPTTPMPPTPPTPAPVQTSLTQLKCPTAGCNSNCTNHTFQTNQCLPAQGGLSVKVTCTASTITETEYNSADCTGMSQSNSAPANTCDKAQGGGYLENICNIGMSSSRNSAEEGDFFQRKFVGLKRMQA